MDEYVCEMADDYPDVPYGSDDYSGTVERRERIVRCRDCEHASPCPLADSEKLICAFHDEMLVDPDDFCAWRAGREDR